MICDHGMPVIWFLYNDRRPPIFGMRAQGCVFHFDAAWPLSSGALVCAFICNICWLWKPSLLPIIATLIATPVPLAEKWQCRPVPSDLAVMASCYRLLKALKIAHTEVVFHFSELHLDFSPRFQGFRTACGRHSLSGGTLLGTNDWFPP